MKVIFEEYSGMIITAVVIVSIIVLVSLFLGTDGPVHTAFTNVINGLFSKANLS